jgi:flagellar basal-body rod protein FlgF
MESTAFIAISRQMVLREQMTVLSNNIANLQTPGYKGEQPLFVEYLDTSTPSDPQSYVQHLSLIRDFNPGPLESTNNPLDLGIKGDGFFTVSTADGPRYTRNGTFTLNADRQITTLAGEPLLGQGDAPIQIPPDSGAIVIATDGTVSTEVGQIGRIPLVTFADKQQLKKIGDGLYDPGTQPTQPAEGAEIHQGMIEGSNVQGVVEMARMVDTVRSYQSANRLIDEEHQRLRKAIDTLVATT